MADQDFALGVRTEADGTDQRMHVKIVDGTNPSVNQASVDSDKNLHVLNEGHDPSGTAHPLRVSQLGAITPDGVYDGTNNTKPGNVGVISSTRNATPGDTTQSMRLTGINSSTVNALDISLHDSSGNPYTNINPLPVSIEESAPGTEVVDYQTSSAVAANASVNHDYSVTSAKTLKLKQIWVSASGKLKAVVQTSPDGVSFSTIYAAFNSTASPNIDIDVASIKSVTGVGSKVRVTLTNLDNQAQDLYSTRVGTEE